MKIEIKIDEACSEAKVIILTDKMTPEINVIVQKLSESESTMLAGFKNDVVEAIEENDIFRVYASSGKVYAVTSGGEYLLKLRLYELEERLDKSRFVRISNSEIINLKKVKNFDMSFVGTICVTLKNGEVTYVSRRFVSKIKQLLGI